MCIILIFKVETHFFLLDVKLCSFTSHLSAVILRLARKDLTNLDRYIRYITLLS